MTLPTDPLDFLIWLRICRPSVLNKTIEFMGYPKAVFSIVDLFQKEGGQAALRTICEAAHEQLEQD